MTKPDGGPAYPANEVTLYTNENVPTEFMYHPGMSLRDAFAMTALQGLLTRKSKVYWFDEIAQTAYKFADTMLAEREK